MRSVGTRRGNQRRGQLEAPGHYRTFYVKAWGASHHRALSDIEEHVYLKLTIGPKACSLPGLILLGRGAVGDLFKYTPSALDVALSGLVDKNKLLVDWPHQVLWAPFGLYEQQYVASPKTALGWCSNLTNIPTDSPLRAQIILDTAIYLEKLGPNFVESLAKLVGPLPGMQEDLAIPYRIPSAVPSQVSAAETEAEAEAETSRTKRPHSSCNVERRRPEPDAGERPMQAVTFQGFLKLLHAAGIYREPTALQTREFEQLASERRTPANLNDAAKRTQQRAQTTQIINPVSYMLRTAASLPLDADSRPRYDMPTGFRLEDIRQRWWRGLDVICLERESAWLLEQSGISLPEARQLLHGFENADQPQPLQSLLQHAQSQLSRRSAGAKPFDNPGH